MCVVAPVLALGGCLGTGNVDDESVRTIDLAEARALHRSAGANPDRAVFLDARTEARFAERRIAGARRLDLATLDESATRDPVLSRADRLVVYADNPGSASGIAAAKRLLGVGFRGKRVAWFSGGLDEWSRAGLPIEP